MIVDNRSLQSLALFSEASYDSKEAVWEGNQAPSMGEVPRSHVKHIMYYGGRAEMSRKLTKSGSTF